MSRFFDGGSTPDRITFSAGAMTGDQGPITMAVLARGSAAGFTGWAVSGMTAASVPTFGLLASGNMFMEDDFSTGGPDVGTEWKWMVATKPSGSVPPRWHVLNLTTPAPWNHVNGPGNVPDRTGVTASILAGGWAGGGLSWRGEIAAIAVWDTELNDAAVEAVCTLSAADLLAGTPKWMIRLNQASTATPVTDDTGNGGDQTAISGTAVDADEPPGWDYSLADPTPVSSTITGKWLVYNEITSALTGKWKVLQKASAALTGKWRVLQRISSIIRGVWSVEGVPVAPPVQTVGYLAAQRRMTKALIDDDPTTAALIPQVRANTASGGFTQVPGTPRVEQTFKLSLLAYDERPTVTVAGVERRIDYHLIGMPEMLIEVGDYWIDDANTRYEVVGFSEGWDYEVKAFVIRHVPREANP